MSKKLIRTLALLLIVLLFSSGCVLKASDTDNTVTQSIEVVQTTKEPTETAAATTAKPTPKVTATPAPTVKETTAVTTTKATETTAPAATTKAPAATTATTKAPAATTAAPPVETAASPVETAPPQTAAPAYAENCDNIKSLVIAQLQAKGLWYPDAEVNGGGSKSWTVGYGSADEQYATSFVNGKFGTPDGTGATSVSVWIESGYLNISYIGCILPSA